MLGTMPGPSADRPRSRLALLLALSLALHVPVGLGVLAWAKAWRLGQWQAPVSVQIIPGDALPDETPLSAAVASVAPREEPEEETEPEPEPELDRIDGQVVETPPPALERAPLQADYLAEHDNAVPEETRTAAFKVNPDILSNQYSRESRLQISESPDLGFTDPSPGATSGGSPNPLTGRGAPDSAIPSQFALQSREGLATPSPASASQQSFAGAPQNDLLDEKLGAKVALNTREFVGAAYINRVKRAVNFWWTQQVDNLSPSVRLSRPRYLTVVAVVLDGSGSLESIAVTGASGLDPLDLCVTEAFRLASPFPNPPVQLVRRDGRVYLDEMDFTVQVGHASMRYSGVDPRGDVQFPGILNAPR
jgi:hypothetical protein